MNRHGIQLRPLASLLLFFSFLSSLVSGIALFLRPEGELARLIAWTWLGLDKKSWEQVHIGAIFLLVMSALWHTLLNRKSLWHYVYKKSAALRIQVNELIIAVILVLLFSFGSLLNLPPFSWLSELRLSIKSGTLTLYTEPTEKTKR